MAKDGCKEQMDDDKQQQSSYHQKQHTHLKHTAHFLGFVFAQTARNDDLCADAKPQTNNEQQNIEGPSYRRRP